MKTIIGGVTFFAGAFLIAANTQPFNWIGAVGILVVIVGVLLFAGSANKGPFK